MPESLASRSVRSGLDILRAELPDLAYNLERQGRLDAADVVMMLHARVREIDAEQSDVARREAPRSPATFILNPP